MPPKRKAKISAPPPAISPRKTRSATAVKRADTPALAPARARAPSKKAKLSTAGNAEETHGAKKKADSVKAKDDVSGATEALAAPPHAAAASVGAAKTIIIEACKQCTSFKTRAIKVKEGLESAVPGIVVAVNPDKPRRGCFEIREENGQVFVSLLDARTTMQQIMCARFHSTSYWSLQN
ncbi:hypothetical protein MUK42_23934 [Musa troglodytarum]|uniref:Selenoprotein H n=1 Tax=Musa troglodytarum TaxID=320322 RepID=A0A9E7G5I5_9LILI|nr:hypothetical protein MUK42_23934 [Musa troglodytarum]URE07037.1 hypothetical protein MUK42_23934 [Musa troglodytarum]